MFVERPPRYDVTYVLCDVMGFCCRWVALCPKFKPILEFKPLMEGTVTAVGSAPFVKPTSAPWGKTNEELVIVGAKMHKSQP